MKKVRNFTRIYCPQVSTIFVFDVFPIVPWGFSLAIPYSRIVNV